MVEFSFHTKCFQHQTDVFESTKDVHAYGIFWEMGGGKSKHIIDLATYLFLNDRIDAVLIVAPNGLHANWDMPGEGIRKHMLPELLDISITYRHIWYSHRSQHKATKTAYAKLMAAKFAWLFMGIDAINTKDGFKAAEHFVKHRRCFIVIDESQKIKNKSASRTKKMYKIRDVSTKNSPWRRILTGTPAEQKPFDVWAQIDWLLPGYWKEQGLGSYLSFKHYFAEWRKAKMPNGHEVEVQRKDRDGRLIYKNLNELTELMKPISSRLLKDDIFDLPPKVYTRAYYELSPKQRKMYDQMEQNYVLWYEENSVPDPDDPNRRILTASAELPIVRQLRLHQLAMGYITTDDGTILSVADPNPALELLREITMELPHSAIIWCRFRKDVELVKEMLGNSAVEFHGGTSQEDRLRNVQAFQAGDVPNIVATNAMAEGWTLTRAKTCIYYSNDRKLGKRKQSEDRAHRPGQDESVQYVDVIAANTISEIILDGLILGEEISASVMGDKIRNKWR